MAKGIIGAIEFGKKIGKKVIGVKRPIRGKPRK